MSEVSKGLVSCLIIMCAAGAVVAGTAIRNRNDLGESKGAWVDNQPSDLLASSQDGLNVPASTYFDDLSEKLKEQYVEPIPDDQKLAVGAVKSMVGSLLDPKSSFMNKDEFHAMLNQRIGQFSGIGVSLAFQYGPADRPKAAAADADDSDSNEVSAAEALAVGMPIPEVVVSDVVPGSPADKAGVKPGDVVYSVDGHWVANVRELIDFRKSQDQYIAKKLDKPAYIALRNDIRKKTERALMPQKVREKLILDDMGAIEVVWRRGSKQFTTDMQKAPSQLAGFVVQGDTVRLPFAAGSVNGLKNAIAGKKEVTIDLRHNVSGDYTVMENCLNAIAPPGQYGTLYTEKKESPQVLTVKRGNPHPPQVTLLVDRTTSGSAEIFALALSSHGHAKLSGTEMGGDLSVEETVELPDGSGYTLVKANYKTAIDTSVVADRRNP